MWAHHPELLETPVPRYTSFPTAAEFGAEIGPVQFEAELAQVSGDISLYVHIPYCDKICWYCGCNTGAANRKSRLASYLHALHREIELVAGHLRDSVRVNRLAFGGGSPNAIAPGDFACLFETLRSNFRFADPLVSVELDPRSLTSDWQQVLSDVAVTHASLGVQTLEPSLQEAIGRVQPLHMIEWSTRLLRASGVRSLNFDLIYGLPGQTQAQLAETLARAVTLGPDRIALFGYAHVPQLIPRQRRVDASQLPDQSERFAMAELGHSILYEAGYVPIGFDHFAKPGDPLAQAALAGRLHRNFQGFTDDDAEVLIGLGASAISSFPRLLVQNEKNAGRYRMLLSQDVIPASGGIARFAEDRYRGAVIEALLCHGRARVGSQLLGEAVPGLMPFIMAGLCGIMDNELTISPRGLPYARSIAAQFDPYRKHSPRRFSSAV